MCLEFVNAYYLHELEVLLLFKSIAKNLYVDNLKKTYDLNNYYFISIYWFILSEFMWKCLLSIIFEKDWKNVWILLVSNDIWLY